MHNGMSKDNPTPLNPYDLNSESEFWGTGDGFKPAKRRLHKKIFYSTDEAVTKQLHGTREIQRHLSEALDNLESCKTASEIRLLAPKINNLYKKAEHLALVIEVLGRLNEELKFCRKKIAKTKEKQTRDVITHRIQWLEKSILSSAEKNNLEKLDEVLELQSIPEPKKKRIKKSRVIGHGYPSGTYSTYSSLISEVTPYPSSPPKSILHLTSEYTIPPYPEKTPSPLKKAVTLIPPSIIEHVETELKVPEDAADVYWMTDHHRYAYTPNKEVIMEEIPHSYHYLGLAVPANFVPPPLENYISTATLPWLTEQDASKGNFDILREDLERVLRRTRRIQEKVWRAANMSVEFDDEGERTEEKENEKFMMLVKLRSRGSTRDRMRPNTRGSIAASVRSGFTLAAASSKKSSREGSSSSTMSSSGSFLSGGILGDLRGDVCDNIPLTRTNMSKRYPHTCDRWTDARPDPDHMMAQKSVVNQRNLYNQTKIRLFVPKCRKPRSSVRRDLITPNSVTSNRSFRKIGTGIRFIEKLKSSGGDGLSQLQRDRINDLLNNSIKSSRVEDRVYTCQSLSSLGITDTDSVIPVLCDVVSKDPSSIVRYQASKALLNLGHWQPEAIAELIVHLQVGNVETQLDVLEQISCTSNVRKIYIDLADMQEMQDLLESLKKMVVSNKTNEEVSFHCAVCLGEICGIYDEDFARISEKKLRNVALNSVDWDTRAQSLEVLMRCLGFCDEKLFWVVVKHLRSAIKWKDRLAAALLIAYLGASKLQQMVDHDTMYQILRHKLWDDVKRDVRLGVSQALTALGMRSRLLEDLDISLRDTNEDIRSQAVIAMSAAGIRSDTTLRYLVEMLGLDASDYVRLQVIRSFHALGVTDIRVVRAVRERERAGGPLARAARRYLSTFDIPLMSSQSARRHHDSSSASGDNRNVTLGNSSWMTSPSRNRSHLDTRGSNMMTRESNRTKSNPQSPIKGSRRASLGSLNPDDLVPKYEIISTAVRTPSRKSAPGSQMSFGRRSGILASASSFF